MHNFKKQWKEYTIDEKIELLTKAKTNDNASITKIWLGVEGLLMTLCIKRKFNAGSLTVEDLMQESFIVFKDSIMNYDITNYTKKPKGADFATFATNNIRKGFVKIIASKGSFIKIPTHLHTKNYKLKLTLKELGLEKIDDKNIKVIAEKTGLSTKEINKIKEVFSAIPYLTNSEITHNLKTTNIELELEIVDTILDNLSLTEGWIVREIFGIGVPRLRATTILKKHKINRRIYEKTLDNVKEIYENYIKTNQKENK